MKKRFDKWFLLYLVLLVLILFLFFGMPQVLKIFFDGLKGQIISVY